MKPRNIKHLITINVNMNTINSNIEWDIINQVNEKTWIQLWSIYGAVKEEIIELVSKKYSFET